jgi:hypothetical protein
MSFSSFSRVSLGCTTLCCMALTAFLGIWGQTAVHASDLGIKAGGQESSIQEIVAPGQTITSYIEVSNTNREQPKVGSIMAKDSVLQENGSFEIIPTSQENTGVGTWVTVDEPVVTLGPGELKRVGVTVKVPSDIGTGSYAAGIAIMENTPDSEQGNVRVLSRVAIQMHLVVLGDLSVGTAVQELGITQMAGSTKAAGFFLGTKNDGNLFTTTNLALDLSGPNGYHYTHAHDAYVGPQIDNAKLPIQFDLGEWKNGAYSLAVMVTNKPLVKKLTPDQFVYRVRKQKIVFAFDYKDGDVTNVRITEQKKTQTESFDIPLAKKETWYKPGYLWIGIGVVTVAAAIFTIATTSAQSRSQKTSQVAAALTQKPLPTTPKAPPEPAVAPQPTPSEQPPAKTATVIGTKNIGTSADSHDSKQKNTNTKNRKISL